MGKTKTPPLSEFIDLDKRSKAHQSGYTAMSNRVTVAVYNIASGYQTLTVRISDDLATKLGLVVGARLSCLIHPDGQHIALKPTARDERGASLYRPRKGRSIVYQTTLAGGTLDAQAARDATMDKVEGTFVITLG